MAYSVNTTPLLQEQYESDSEENENEIVVRDGKPLFKAEPIDRFYVTYFIFYLMGVVSLIPWNFFITADDYWMYKFRNISSNTSIRDAPPTRSPLQAEFTSYLNISANYPGFICLIFNTAISQRVSLNIRVLGSLYCMLALMLLTLVFVNINTDGWQNWFFIITMTTSVLLNVFSPIFSGSIIGIVGKFSPIYITAVVGGQALGGIFASITQIVSLAIGASPIKTAVVYFVIGNASIAVAIVLYIVLQKTTFFTFYTSNQTVMSINDFPGRSMEDIISFKEIMKKIWYYCFCTFFTYIITVAIFPGVTVLVESENKGHGSKWSDVYFVPTITYLLFNVGDYTGRLLAGTLLWPKKKTGIIILTLLRVVYIPLILLCNAQPRHSLPVVFNKDYQYVLIQFTFAFSNGYMTNVSQILAPRVVDRHEKEIASSIAVVFIGIGAAIGATIGILLVKLI